MRRNPRRNPWIRAVVTLLIAAMLVTNNTAATFAGEISQDETIINTVTDQEDTGSENVQQEPEGEKPSGEEAPAEVPVDEKPAEEEPSGEGPLGEGPAEDASSDEIIGENEAEDGVPDEDVIDEGTLELDGSVVIDEAHGEVGQIIRYSFRSFSNQSRTDYYHRYYNQLGAYGKEIYDYLEEHAEDFIEQDPTVENYKPLELKVYGDTPVSYEELQNFLRDVKEQIYYAYAAFDYDHPEVFWLNTDSFIFQYGRYSNAAETKFYPVVLFACDEKFSSFTYYDRNACDEVKSEIQGNVNTIVAGTRSQNGIKAKLTVINDWLSNNNYYNRYVYQGEQADPRTWKSAAALTAQTWLTSSSDMGDPKAPVCEAYSRAFKMVCDEIGIPCILVPGDGHMWNYVQNEDGVWYAMDVTWDDPVRWDECTNRITPDFWIHRYIMVGSQTVVSGKNQTFQADGHRPNGVFWTGGKPMPTPGISETAYEEDLSAQISNLSVLTGPDEMQISYDTDRVGTYYYVLQTAGQDAPSVYEIQDLVSDIENGSGYGTVTKKQAEEGTVTFSAPNPPEGTYDLYLIQLTTDEYISPVLHLEDLDPDLYVGWRRIDHKDYYFCPENYEGWEDNLDAEGNHVNDMGAMATGAVWIKDVLYKFGEDGACEKIWHRIKEITLEGFAEPEPQIVLQRGRTRQLSVVYTPEEDNLPLDEITDNMRVTWTSSDPQTVSVDSDGTLHALQNTAAGVKVRITGTTGDSTNKYHPTVTLDVTVTHPEGWFMVEGNRFFGKKTGDTVTLVTELQEIEGKTYYFYPGNDTEHVPYSMATGIVKIDGQYYDFGENGVRISDEAITNGFVTHGGETYYFAGGERQIGIHKIGSHYYGFDNSGAMYRDAFFKRDNGGTTRYYFAGTDGILATGTCYASEQGVSYFADEDYAETNAVPVCSMQSGIVTLADGSYYFSVLSEENGAGDLTVNGGLMQYGYFAGANGKHYYALPKDSANAGKLQSGWVLVENAWKLFGEPDSESPFAESDKQYTNGWIETGATGTYKRYYVDLNGKLLSGWQTVDGNRYYFDIDGAVASGFRRIGKSCYLFGTIHNFGAQEDDYGILLTGLRVYGGHTYYADAGGVLQLGWQKIDGIWRYFDSEHGYEIEAPVRTDYWFTTDDGKYYFQNGTVMVTGVRQIDGAYYYFSTNKDDGSLGRLICSEFITVGKNTYYADENGVLQSGLIAIAPPSVYAGTYYLDENRILQTGFQTIAGKNYYFENDGRMAKGWFIFRNDKYYATEDGSLQTAGLHELNTRTYCFDASGKLLTGWQVTDPATGSRRYFNDVVPKEDIQYGAAMLTPYQVNGYYGVTENGEIHYYYFVNNSMLKGWQTINGKKYCFGTDGCLQTGIFKYNNAWYCTSNTGKTGELGAVIPGLRSLTINGVRRTYNCDTNGKCLTGWQKIDGKTYYFNPVAGDDYGAMLFGRIKIGTKYYFTDHDGVKQTNTFINSYGETYFANASGVLLTGFQTIKVAGNSYRFYFDTEGRMKTGWTTISNAGYYFCPDGAGLPMGAMLSGLQEIGGKDYYFNTKGVLQTGWQKANNAWNYYATQADVTAGRTDTLGEICDNVDIDTPERYWRTVTFENGDQSRFFIKNNATVLKGWQNLKVENVQRRYYFDSVSGEMYKGLSQIGNASYRLHDTEGYVLAEGWENNCYFNAKGQMLTGWQTFKVNGVNRVLYLNPEDGKWNKGEAASATGETFIIEVAGKKYRLDADGYRFTVACSDDGYYSDKNGLIKTGWQKINNVWCYYATPEDEAAGRVEKWGVFCPDTPEGYWRRIAFANGEECLYYINNKGKLLTGWQNIKENNVTKRYYFNSTGELQTGDFAVKNVRYHTNEQGIPQSGFWKDENDLWFYSNANGQILTGWQSIKGDDGIVRKYYLNANGVLLTGLQKINGYAYYFDEGDVSPESRIPGSGGNSFAEMRTGEITAPAGACYYANTKGVLQSGWQKYKGAGEQAASWKYYDPVDFENANAVCVYPGEYWYQMDGDWYYFNRNASLAKGFTTVRFYDEIYHKYYFDPTGKLVFGQGNLLRVGSDTYYVLDARNDRNGNPRPETGARINQPNRFIDKEGERYYFDASGKAFKGLQTIKVNGVAYKFYFDPQGWMQTGWQTIAGADYYFCPDGVNLPMGRMATGFQSIGGKDYYFNTKGGLQTGWQKVNNTWNYYATQADVAAGRIDTLGEFCDDVDADTPERYWWTVSFDNGEESRFYIKNNATVLKGWQNLKVGNVQRRYYFDPVSGEMYKGLSQIGNTYYRLHDTEGYVLAEGWQDENRYYDANGRMQTGWKTIGGNTYYFDSITGMLATGITDISGKKYLFDDAGVLQKGKTEYYGNYYFPNTKGELRFGWITDTSRRYYADPVSGKLRIGFATISGNNYYFNEEASKAGELCTGFFHVPALGQSYYDTSANASNLYYAASDGKLHAPGWEIISLNPADKNAQKWSYYFSANIVGQTPEGAAICGEAATGDVLIHADGTVAFLGTAGNPGGADAGKYYTFDANTGARRKTVLVFYGNYYGETDYDCDRNNNNEIINVRNVRGRFSKEQVEGLASLSRYINSDRTMTETDAVYYVNSNRAADQARLYAAGFTTKNPAQTTFPMAASSYGDEDERRVYVANNDIASGSGIAGADGNVDVYDVEMYSWDVYQKAISKVGTNNLVLVGVSSGGGICLALCQKAIGANLPLPANTILFSPWVDLAMDNSEIAQITPKQSEFMDIGTAKYWAARYTRDNELIPEYHNLQGHESPEGVGYAFASPINGTMAGLSNVVIYTGSYDLFCPDSKKLANAATAAGSDVTISVKAGMVHAYMFNKPTLSASVQVMREAAQKIMTQ